MSATIDILHLYPELTAIGQKDFQVYCDEWSRCTIAREFRVAQVEVDSLLLLNVNVDAKLRMEIKTYTTTTSGTQESLKK